MRNNYLFERGIRILAIFLFLVCLIPLYSQAAPLKNIPQTVKQPDGTILNCFASGDEFYSWLHDANGYTIIQNPKTGYYVYAIEENGVLVSSSYIAGKDNPVSKGLKPYASYSNEYIQKKRQDYKLEVPGYSLNRAKGEKQRAPINTTTVLNNIVVFIKFADDTQTDTISFWDPLYNNTVAPSLSTYYLEASYNQFTIKSTFYPTPSGNNVVWYTDTKTRNYYKKYNSLTNPIGYNPDIASSNATDTTGKTYREHALLKRAITSISSQIPVGLNIDSNNDGYVDCISFIVAGFPDGWNELIWPHRWGLWSASPLLTINSKKVYDYTFQMQLLYANGTRMNLGTVAHEMFHIVGAPDLYHYATNSTIDPVGPWDLMENTGSIPQHMLAYMKYTYGGWISNIPEITTNGTYTLNPLSSSATQNCYRIPALGSYTEYFMVEYRNKTLYDATKLPGEGLVVYRINSKIEGNSDGPPDEVYVYRPGGTTLLNGTINTGFFNLASGRTTITDLTNPSSFLTDGTVGGLKITNIGAAGSTISFNVAIDFTPLVVIKNDKGPYSAIGDDLIPFSVASRFVSSDLTSYVGRHITKVDYYIRKGGGNDVTIKVWEGGSFGNPGTLVYSKNVSTELAYDSWSSHALSKSVQIKANTEYWIGYSIKPVAVSGVTPAGGYPAGVDKGPIVAGKGGWISEGGAWSQLSDYNMSYNFLVRGVISPTGVGVSTQEISNINIDQNYPNPFSSSTTFRFKTNKPGHVTINIYNSIGQLMDIAVDKDYDGENHEVNYNGSKLNSGIYYYTLVYKEKGTSAAPITQTRKMSIIR